MFQSLLCVSCISLIVSLCITINITMGCPTDSVKETLKHYLVPHVSSKLEGVFCEQYVSSPLASSFKCACIKTMINEKGTKKENTRSTILIGENNGSGKEVRLRVFENRGGRILFKGKVLLVAKMYPVFATDNVIGYVMCVPLKNRPRVIQGPPYSSVVQLNNETKVVPLGVKEFDLEKTLGGLFPRIPLNLGYSKPYSYKLHNTMDGHTVLWATIMVRSGQLTNPKLDKDIEEAHNKIKSIPLNKEVTTLVKREIFCPECKKQGNPPAKT